VFISSQILAPGLLRACCDTKTRLMVSMDVTGPAMERDLRNEPAPNGAWPVEQAIYTQADLLVPWSSWIGDSLRSDFSVPAERIRVVPPSLPIAPRPPARPAGSTPRILFCGNDWERKGGPRLLAWHQEHWA
jgi:hypothetical protein